MYVGFHVPHLNQLGFKVPEDLFLSITDSPYIVPSKYMARFHWVDIPDRNKLPNDVIKQHIETSYRLVVAKLSKKKQRELDNIRIL